ncbi:hypothetical protein [Arthrobacter crystallopoietes]|uniref:Uncharacterized protein n=1 Tax=Crystallibacter crystallopoietes TaxID=37928 RepID=A0A1H1A5H5_9MICC|nr:hypothetical protein [Arthrobacter crystallopoietes]SDQ34955.1 hypothetical protein SAMN04489742_0764 [Arthrobacter crystallopoietes]
MRVELLSRVPVLLRKVVLTAAATAGFALFGIAGASAADADGGLLTEVLSSETQTTTATLTEELKPVTDNVGAATGKLAPVTGQLAAVTEKVAPVVEKAAAPAGAASESVGQTTQPVTGAAHEVAGAVAAVSDPVLESAAPLTEPVLETAADVVEPVVESGTSAVQPVVTPVVEAAAPVADPVIEAAAPVVDPVEEAAEPIVDAVEAGGLASDTADSNGTITAVEDGPTAETSSSVPVAAAEVSASQLEKDPTEAATAAGASDNRQEEGRETAPAPAKLQPTPAQFLAQMAYTPSAVMEQDAHRAAGESYPGQPVAAIPAAVPAGVGGSGSTAAGGNASAGQSAADVPFSNLLPPFANSGTTDGSAWSLPASRSSDPGSSPD